MKDKAEFGSDPIAQGGQAAVERHNKEFYQKATPKQREIIDAVEAEIAKTDKGFEDQYFLERVGFYAEMNLDEVMSVLRGMKAGEFRLFGKGHFLVKTYTNEIQELQAYTRRLETVVARGEAEKYLQEQLVTAGKKLNVTLKSLDTAEDQILTYRERSFWQQIKAAFRSLRSK